MSRNLRVKFLAGATALAVGGTAMANTTLNTTTGDVFVNVVDVSNGTSFLFDTGVSQAAFNGGSSYSFNFASDPNYTAFLAAEGGSDVVDYSVFSATTGAVNTTFFTSSIAVPSQTSTKINGGASTIGSFLTGANSIVQNSTTSVNLGSTFAFGNATWEGVITTDLLNAVALPNGTYPDDAALGTALAFYEDAASRTAVITSGQAFAGTWDVTGGVATYTAGVQAVPLPTPVLLLLSGLGLMGVVARRNKMA